MCKIPKQSTINNDESLTIKIEKLSQVIDHDSFLKIAKFSPLIKRISKRNLLDRSPSIKGSFEKLPVTPKSPSKTPFRLKKSIKSFNSLSSISPNQKENTHCYVYTQNFEKRILSYLENEGIHQKIIDIEDFEEKKPSPFVKPIINSSLIRKRMSHCK